MSRALRSRCECYFPPAAAEDAAQCRYVAAPAFATPEGTREPSRERAVDLMWQKPFGHIQGRSGAALTGKFSNGPVRVEPAANGNRH